MSREYRQLLIEEKGLRQEARRQRTGASRQSPTTWFRGVTTPNGQKPTRIGNLSGEAFVSSSRAAAQGFGKNVLKLMARGRYFSHDKRGHLRALPAKLRARVAATRDSTRVGALYATDGALRAALRKRGFAGVQWRHQGAIVRYAFDSERTLSRR